jgi:phenylalanyl-tRNA synthetase beta chain
MKISYNWLREFVATTTPAAELGEKLTNIGLAVEAVHQVDDDFILDFDLTSNRPDCLSHAGIAREVAALEGLELRFQDTRAFTASGKSQQGIAIEIKDPTLCPRYAGRVVKGVKIGPSPEWLVRRLEAIGQRSINNVADITNYVLHELGQPLHAFDVAQLNGKQIIVRRAAAGERIRTLDGVDRELEGDMLVIADAVRPVALAGIMGGEDSEISDETTDVLIESAYFNPDSVRRTARRLGLHTEASHRFERGTDPEGVLRAQERCVQLIRELAGGESVAPYPLDDYPEPQPVKVVTLRPSRIYRLTGLSAGEAEIERILTRLGFEPCGSDEAATLRFKVPSWRVDISREEDLVEEVARFIGFDKIEAELPSSAIAGDYYPTERRKRALRTSLSLLGFDEAINFSFVDTSYDEQVEVLPDLASHRIDQARFLTLRNPIVENWTRMRATLIPGLLESVRRNFNHGNRDLKLFELGRIFAESSVDGQLPKEQEAFALALTGGALDEGHAVPLRELDFYDLKAAIETACDAVRLPPPQFEAAEVAHLRQGQSARIVLNGRQVGSAGRLAEKLAAPHKFRQPVFVAELDLTALLAFGEEESRYTPLPRFPAVQRDVSLIVDRRVTLADALRLVRSLEIAEREDVSFVAVYEGSNIPEGYKSLTIRVAYRAADRTLRDEEVERIHARIVHALETEFQRNVAR